MATQEEISEEVRQLKRTLRDLAGLSMLPAAWIGYEPEAIADSLADVLMRTLALDLIYIRLQATAKGDFVEVVYGSDQTDVQAEVVYQALAPWVDADSVDLPASIAIANPVGAGRLRIAVRRFGDTGQLGVMVAGSRRPDFPAEADCLLLGVAANQTAVVIQRKHDSSLARAAFSSSVCSRVFTRHLNA